MDRKITVEDDIMPIDDFQDALLKFTARASAEEISAFGKQLKELYVEIQNYLQKFDCYR
jgi:hypothetical protein